MALALLIMGILNAQAQADRQFIRSGNRLFHAGNYVKAEAEYLKAVQKNPNNAQAVYNLGCAMMMQLDFVVIALTLTAHCSIIEQV